MMESSTELEQLPTPSSGKTMIMRILYNQQVRQINDYLTQKEKNGLEKVPAHVKSLAHLNSRQLITLLDEWIFPISQRYAYLLNQEQEQAVKDILNANHEKLCLIKQQIHDGLLVRCQISAQFNLPRQVDDLLVYDATEAKNQKDRCATLDDDSRLIIYDTLLAAGFAKDLLEQDVIKPIPKRSYQALRDAKTLDQAVKQAYEFSDKVCSALNIKRKTPSRFAVLTQQFTKQATALFTYVGLPKWPSLWRFRYVFYFILSFAAYYMLTHALTIMGIMLISETIFSFIASGLFYTVALFPLWWFIGEKFSQSVDYIHQKWCSPKESQIIEALLTLEQNEQFIDCRLNQVIVDIIHYDFDALKTRLLQIQTNIKTLTEKLPNFAWTEKIACGTAIKLQIDAIDLKLQEQETARQAAVQRVIEHLMLRTEEELLLLEQEQTHSTLAPVFPNGQYQKIKAFITEFGTPAEVTAFEQKANIAQIWVKKLDQFVLSSPEQTSWLMHQPWGGQVVRKDLLKGWQILLNQLGDESAPCKSALAINELLRGRKKLTMLELSAAVSHLAKPEDAAGVLSAIQSVVFSTLCARSRQQASLLSFDQKKLIAIWYEANQQNISKANDVMKKLFSEKVPTILDGFTNAELAFLYQTLDGADIYHCAHNLKNSRQNQVRHFFERYQGDSSCAFLLCRFIPEKQERQLLAAIAKRRLAWMLSHLEQGVDPVKPFDQYDLEFFLQHEMSKQFETFNVIDAIRKSPEFTKPWSRKMEQFLDSCRRYGLDSGKLLTQYQAKNVQVKAFVLQQFHQSKQLKLGVTCGKEHHARTKPSFSHKGIVC